VIQISIQPDKAGVDIIATIQHKLETIVIIGISITLNLMLFADILYVNYRAL
jgi:hypothetical protein